MCVGSAIAGYISGRASMEGRKYSYPNELMLALCISAFHFVNVVGTFRT
jgi:hypothetical protein